MTSSTAKQLEKNITNYSKNHFRHNKVEKFVPSLLKMQIHEKDNIDSPSTFHTIVTNK